MDMLASTLEGNNEKYTCVGRSDDNTIRYYANGFSVEYSEVTGLPLSAGVNSVNKENPKYTYKYFEPGVKPKEAAAKLSSMGYNAKSNGTWGWVVVGEGNQKVSVDFTDTGVSIHN